jgi:signal transduction histidine kinase
MKNFPRGKDWISFLVQQIPSEYKESFLLKTGNENLDRSRILCIGLIVISIIFFLDPGILETESGTWHKQSTFINFPLSITALIVLASSQIIFSKLITRSVGMSRVIVILFAGCLLWWGSYIGVLYPFGLKPTVSFLICLFVAFSVFTLTIFEAVVIILSGVLVFCWFYFTSTTATDMPNAITLAGLLFVLIIAFFVSRAVYYSRLSSFLNWENISAMNRTLKWEIKKHQQTFQELEAIKTDLDRQVSEKTHYLSEANEQLRIEIAERSYADKVKTVLYRIAGYVNQTSGLKETIDKIHEELGNVIDVTNFMVGTYDQRDGDINPVYQNSFNSLLERCRVSRTLSARVIRSKRSLLINKLEINDLVSVGEIDIPEHISESWLGVPLLVEDRLVGILIVESFKAEVIYDQSEQQLLEYVSEHLSLAIDRYEVQSRLIKAKEQAEESDRLKSSFLSNLSHEIRTPLNSIVGFSEIMAETDTSDLQRQEYALRVVDNGHRLLATLSKMIELAKLQAHQMVFDIQALEVGREFSVLRSEVESITSLFGRTGLGIHFEIEMKDPKTFFWADATRFRQIMRCLVENAVKFTNQGYIEIGC